MLSKLDELFKHLPDCEVFEQFSFLNVYGEQSIETRCFGLRLNLNDQTRHLLPYWNKFSLDPSLYPPMSFEVLDVVLPHSWARNKSYYNKNMWDLPQDWALKIRLPDLGDTWISMTSWLAETVFGVHLAESQSGKLVFMQGTKLVARLDRDSWELLAEFSYDKNTPEFTFMWDSLNRHARTWAPVSFKNTLRHVVRNHKGYTPTHDLTMPGLSKIYKSKLRALVDELDQREDFVALAKFRSIVTEAGRTIAKVKISTVLNAEFDKISTADELKNFVLSFENSDRFFENLSAYRANRKTAVKKDADRALVKIFDELKEMPFTAESHPVLYKSVQDGDIPLSIFFPTENGETFFLINDQWDLWEEMLIKHHKVTCEIAQEASRRRQYEKDLMSYFYFVLYGLPEYLNEHAGGNWTCSPRLVESEHELEPEAVEEDRGVIKKRSALTPVADNQFQHVVVPYASMAIHGRMTTYCYSHSFYVLRRGMTFDGNVVTKDLEEKLNGKDDYGLMFYTLTGSYTNRGYPTFLIIFERLKQKGKTRVHFHRVHPMRSKEGELNPINNWTQVCYNWMIGNVNKDRIAFQQGDLAFIRLSPEKQAKVDMTHAAKVTTYDSHDFQIPVEFAEYSGKAKHVLGHVRLAEANVLLHPEHDDVSLTEEGIFQVRQCRSWEANPKGIWTLNYD
jgi:hypothetical protein